MRHLSSLQRLAVQGGVLFGICFGIFAMTTAADTSHDVRGAHVQAWRIGLTGDPSLDDVDPALLTAGFQERFSTPEEWLVEQPDGDLVVGRSPGVVAAAVPAYTVYSWVSDDPVMSHLPARLTAAALAAGAVAMLFLALSTVVSRGAALAGSSVFAFATPVWSVAADGMWTHTVTIVGIAGMAYAAARDRWVLAGLFGAVAIWGRAHCALIVAALGLVVAARRRSWRVCLEVGGTSAVGVVLASTWSHWLYGTWRPSGPYDVAAYAENSSETVGGLAGALVNHLGMWVSPDRGLFVWTPVALLAVLAIGRSRRTLPDWSVALLAGGLVYTVVQAQVSPYMGGDGFYGYRHGLEVLTASVPAATVALRSARAPRALLVALCAAQACVIALGAVSEGFTANEPWQTNSAWRALNAAPTLWLVLALAVGNAVLLSRLLASPRARGLSAAAPRAQ
ncbi:hypothetical protein [Nocardioides sp. SYSU DS0663]|uniref:hypothetical protein n=1 Tax=Nocardioides sp. SYSU DS0663 TaxID=3416445 RepID=UPI003F4B1848